MRRLRRPWPVVPSLPLTSCKLSMAGPKGKLLKLLESPIWFPTGSLPSLPPAQSTSGVAALPAMDPVDPVDPWNRWNVEAANSDSQGPKGSHDSVPGFPSQKVPAQKLHEELPNCPEDFWCCTLQSHPIWCCTVFIKQEMRAFWHRQHSLKQMPSKQNKHSIHRTSAVTGVSWRHKFNWRAWWFKMAGGMHRTMPSESSWMAFKSFSCVATQNADHLWCTERLLQFLLLQLVVIF